MPKVDNFANFDSLPNAAGVDAKTVAALFGCSVSAVWDRLSRGIIPKPRKFGGSTRWNVGELRAFMSGDSQ